MTDIDYTTLWEEDAPEDAQIKTYQQLINNGQAWRLEGHIGKTANDLIEAGICVLGEEGHKDFYGNYVPSRTEVEPGTKGSVEYAQNLTNWTDPTKETE